MDFLSIFLWSKNTEGSIPASYANQVALLGAAPDWSKLAVNFELGNPGTTLDDAVWVHDLLTEAGTDHPSILMVWRDYAVIGSADFNEKTSIACFGPCTAPD